MGFLSLFSRQPAAGSTNKLSVKGQSYESTVAADPPVRGTYPVAGNGPNVLDTLSKLPRFEGTRFPLNVNIDDSAPAPSVPRFQPENLSRPKTAPNGSKSTPSKGTPKETKRQSSFRGRTLSFRKSRIIPPVPAVGATPEFAQYGQGFIQVFPPQLPPSLPTPPFSASFSAEFSPTFSSYSHSHQRNRSVLSDGGKSVDILDAQSELSPRRPDFRTRIEAAGARDYGEDVADRNIAVTVTVKNFAIDSSRVKAFYSPTTEGKKRLPNRDLPLMAVPKTPTKTTETTATTATRKQLSLTKSPSLRLFPDSSSSLGSSPDGSKNGTKTGVKKSTSKAKAKTIASNAATNTASTGLQRQPSLSTYRPTGTSSGFSSNTSAKIRPLSSHQRTLSGGAGLDVRPRTADGSSLPARPETSWDIHGRQPDVPPVPHYVPKRTGSVGSKKSKLPVAIPQSYMGQSPATRFHLRFQSPSPPRPVSPESSPPGSVPSTSAFAFAAAASRRHTLQFLSSAAMSGDYQDYKPLPFLNTLHLHSERPSSVKSLSYGRPRTRSMITSRPNALDDIYEFVPERTSSLRNWSLSSTAPTMSSLSSSPFVTGYRPQSRHTANTSIDLSYVATKYPLSTTSLPLPPSRGSIYSTNALGVLEIVPGSPTSPDYFDMDDYMSSDDDSFIAPYNTLGQDGEGLLFREGGYGFSGSELPGLGDAFEFEALGPAPAPAVMRAHLRERSLSPEPEPIYRNRSLKKKKTQSPRSTTSQFGRHYRRKSPVRRRSTRRRNPKKYEATEPDMPTTPMRVRCGRKGQPRLSAIGASGGDDYEDEEDDVEDDVVVMAARRCVLTRPSGPATTTTGSDGSSSSNPKIDVAAAVRKRKQDKARQRASGVARKRSTRGGSVKRKASVGVNRRRSRKRSGVGPAAAADDAATAWASADSEAL